MSDLNEGARRFKCPPIVDGEQVEHQWSFLASPDRTTPHPITAEDIDECVREIFRNHMKPHLREVYREMLGEREGGPMRFESTPREGPNPFYDRIAEAQQRYDMAKPGECVQIDLDLMPHINRTDKCVTMYSDELADFLSEE